MHGGGGGPRAWVVLGTVNTIAMDATQHIVAADATRLNGVRVIGVDEHRWSHTHRPGEDGFVTVIIDLTPVVEGSGRARLLDLVPGRSAAALKTWLSAQAAAFRDQVEVVAMDGFGGYKTAATEVLPLATPVMDPFHVVALAGTKLDLCRQRIQQQTCGHRGRAGDPLYRVRRTLRTRLPLLNSRQKARLEAVFADEAHLAVELCWGFYQRLIAAYNHPDRRGGKSLNIIDALRSGVPDALEELAQLGRTLWRRRADVLAYFDHHASNGPTEAINGRLEALRRNALGFRNLTHYRLRSLLGNICENARKEAIVFAMPSWMDSDNEQVAIVDNNITNGGKADPNASIRLLASTRLTVITAPWVSTSPATSSPMSTRVPAGPMPSMRGTSTISRSQETNGTTTVTALRRCGPKATTSELQATHREM